ncbi:hypothetical protein VR010_03785 [Actinomycetaceae bacterium L2_0104]
MSKKASAASAVSEMVADVLEDAVADVESDVDASDEAASTVEYDDADEPLAESAVDPESAAEQPANANPTERTNALARRAAWRSRVEPVDSGFFFVMNMAPCYEARLSGLIAISMPILCNWSTER